MAISAVVVTGVIGATSSVDFTASGFGAPDAAVLLMSHGITDGTNINILKACVGFWVDDGADSQCCAAAVARNALADSDTYRVVNSAAILEQPSTAAQGSTSSYTAEAITDGIRLTLASGATDTDRLAAVLLLKGIVNASIGSVSLGTGTSAIDVTDPGFRADLVFATSIGHTTADAYTADAVLSYGVAHIAASAAVTQAVVGLYSGDALTDSAAYSVIRDDAVACEIGAGSETWRASVGAHASGFTLTPSASAGSNLVHYLALELPQASDAYLAHQAASTSTGDVVTTGAGFAPQALMGFVTARTTRNTVFSGLACGVGVAGPTAVQRVFRWTEGNALATTSTRSRTDDAVLAGPLSAHGTEFLASLASLDADGWTLNYSDASADGKAFSVLAIGPSPAASAALAGGPAAQATATGALSTQIPVTAAAAVVATATGALSTAIPLAGQTAAVSVAGGVLTARITLSGAAVAQALGAAGLTAQITLSGAAIAQALATAGLATGAGLAGSAAAQSLATGALITQIPLSGSATAHATAAGGLTTIIRLAGAAASVSTLTGGLSTAITLDAAAIAQALAAGGLTASIRLDATALAQAVADGTLSSAPSILAETRIIKARARAWRVASKSRTWKVAA